MRVDRRERGKGLTRALFRGIGKVLGLGYTFTRKVGGGRGS